MQVQPVSARSMSAAPPIASPTVSEGRLLQAALGYAERGWPVFPCNTKTKRPLTEHGFEDATLDASAIGAWWSRYPTALIGVPTGAPIGAFVLDLDAGTEEKTGEVFELEALRAALEAAIGEALPATLTVDTPRGGQHLYFRLPESYEMPGNRAGLVRRVDVRGDGGYVILPPSARADGKSYTWANKRGDAAIAAAPPLLLDFILRRGRWAPGVSAPAPVAPATGLRGAPGPSSQAGCASEAVRKYALSALDKEARAVAGAFEGGRNDQLNRSAFALAQLVAAGALAEGVVRASLEDAAVRCGLAAADGWASVRKTIESGFRGGLAEPRDHLREIERKAEERAIDRRHMQHAGIDRGYADARENAPAPQPLSGEEGSPRLATAPAETEKRRLDAAVAKCARFDQSDTDNGKRLIEYFGNDLLVIAQEGLSGGDFLAWTGAHWDLAGGLARANMVAQRVGDLIQVEADVMEATPRERDAIDAGEAAKIDLRALLVEMPKDRKTWTDAQRERERVLLTAIDGMKQARADLDDRKKSRRRFGVSSKNSARVEGMLKMAAPWLRRSPDAFNCDQYLVACRTHTLRFVRERDDECPDPDVQRYKARVEAIEGHRREHLITALVPADYIPEAPPGKWEAFVCRFLPQPEKRRTVQQFCGLGLFNTPIQRFMFHHGTGANGKSVFLETYARFLGPSFATTLPTESIIGRNQNSGASASPDLARLYGKRVVRVTELAPGQPLQIEVVKKLTGGESIPVRTLFKGFFEFQPTAKPHMSANGYPTIDDTSNGIWRRMISVPWTETIAESDMKELNDVVSDLLTDSAGIFNWLVAGALDYMANGLVIAEELRHATEEYRNEMDTVGQFVRDHVEAAPGEQVTAREMYVAYRAWAEANAKRPVFEQRFSRAMRTKFTRDDKRVVRYLDCRLHDLPERIELPRAPFPQHCSEQR